MGGTQGTGFSKRGMGGDSGSLVELRWAVISVEPREPEVGGDMGGASRNEGGQRRGRGHRGGSSKILTGGRQAWGLQEQRRECPEGSDLSKGGTK